MQPQNDTERRLSELSVDAIRYSHTRNIYNILGIISFFAFFAVLVTTGDAKYYLAFAISLVIAVSTMISAIALWKKNKELLPTSQEVSAIAAFEAFNAVKRLLDTRKPAQRQVARKVLDGLSGIITGWIGTNAPPFLEQPVSNLVDAIDNRAIPIVLNGKDAQIGQLKSALYELVLHLDGSMTSEKFDQLVAQFDALEKVPDPTKKDRQALLKNSKLMYILVAIPFVIGALVWYYVTPQIGASIDTRLTGGLAIALAYVGGIFVIKKVR